MDFGDIDEELSRMAESANDPSSDQAQTIQRRPEDNPLVRAYIAKLNQPTSADPELARLNQAASVRAMFSHPGGSAAARYTATALAGNAGAPVPEGLSSPPPDPYADVKAYIQQKQMAQAQKEQALKDILSATEAQKNIATSDKFESVNDPNSVAGRAEARKGEALKLSGRKEDEAERYHQALEGIQKGKMSAEDKRSESMRLIAEARMAGVDLKESEFQNKLDTSSAPPGLSGLPLDSKSSKKLKDAYAANKYAEKAMNEFQDTLGVWNSLDVGGQRAKLDTLHKVVIDNLNSAYQLGQLTHGRMELLKAEVGDPNKLQNMILQGRIPEQLKAVKEDLNQRYEDLAEAYGQKVDSGPMNSNSKTPIQRNVYKRGHGVSPTKTTPDAAAAGRMVTITDASTGKSVTTTADKASEFMFNHGDEKTGGKSRWSMSDGK